MEGLEILLATLDNLKADELKRFKMFLGEKLVEGCDPIPGRSLETNNVTDIAKVMIRHYRCEKALEVTLLILKRTKQNNLADKLKQQLYQLSRIRPYLIKRTSRAVLRGLLDNLQAQSPPVISVGEAEEILQRSSVLQEQVTSLTDVVLKKGDKACGILLSLLKQLDSFLYQDLGL
ncbi:hypothetical protein ACEWY4_017226 [Coilia grayii]|uniref:Pyrin domain-containing protein n=1 Tax=Coilia grayii TaxID=363190 RepID=A0ABD1JG79_9TELE